MVSLLAGRATAEGTTRFRARFADRAAPDHFRELAGRWFSSIGLGTYLGDDDDRTDASYRDAVVRAVELGVNVFDSAINYRNQRSERALGAALCTVFEQGLARRDELIVATKGGFLAFDGNRPADPRAWLEDTYLRPGILGRADLVAGCHAMTPRWLADQLARSRRNLGLETIDIYYLHNPETQLGEMSRQAFLERVRAAFAELERACAEGHVGVYGTATWSGYRQPEGAADQLVLAELVALAEEVGGAGHHFRMLQLPLNLSMPEALLHKNQPSGGRSASTMEAARQAGLGVMISGSILQGRLARLPAPLRPAIPGPTTDAQRALQAVRSAPGVLSALCGMSRVTHVEENLELARLPALSPATAAGLFEGVTSWQTTTRKPV
jgi:aryl-alcohol dehydrogenase-like predicted oxidoreductase